MRLARACVAGLLLLVVAGAAVVEIGLPWRQRNAEDRLPATRAGAPNVLLIILDTVRALSLSLYGYERNTTPVLDRLAERATVFDRAIVAGTWSLPSHGSMFTGRWPYEIESWWRRPRTAPHPTLAEVLSSNGYRTGAIVANWFTIGHESGIAQGFMHYDDLGHSFGQVLRASATLRWLAERRSVRRLIGWYDNLGRRRAPEINRSFLTWLDANRDRPYFAFLNYFDAHAPYLPPPPFDEQFGLDVSGREPVVVEELSLENEAGENVTALEVAAYDGSIAFLDNEIGKLIDELETRGALANTIVIITSDHGEELGEHGSWGHGAGLYAQSVHVPLLVFGPGVPKGVRIEQPASLRDIAATIAGMVDLPEPPFPGQSLARYWTDPSGVLDDTVITDRGERRSVYVGQYHYIEAGRGDDGAHLYDVVRDREEQDNLIGTALADSITPPILDLLSAFSGKTGGGVEAATGRD